MKLPVEPSGKGVGALKENGKLSLRLKIAYSPIGGATSVQHKKVTLVMMPR